MASDLLHKFVSDPLGFCGRVFRKLLIDRWRYGKGRDYDAPAYWRDRFTRYGRAFRGPGDDGLSEEENQRVYQEAAETFLALCRRQGVDFQSARVLEIGCGTGFYTRLLAEQGVRTYTGVDITDVNFPRFRAEFPGYEFLKRDVGVQELAGSFDLVVMIDVVQHIVEDGKFAHAMTNVRRCLAEGGSFFVNPVADKEEQPLFYVHFRPLGAFQQEFPGHVFGELVPFRGASMVSIRRPASSLDPQSSDAVLAGTACSSQEGS